MRVTVLMAIALAAASIGLGCNSPGPTRLDTDSFEAWRAHLAPSSSELAWESLPWLSSYADGVVAAQEQHRPLLLWVMNGHPLGCT
jgi:hypothetical protein